MAAGLLLAARLVSPDALVERGFEHFFNLEYDQAIADFEAAVTLAPSSPDLHNHVAEALVFREMFRGGALESELVTGNNPFLRRARLQPSAEVEKKFFQEISESMSLCRARLARDAKDARALYALGIAHGLRANWNFLVRKAWIDALRDATTSRKLHNQVSALEPENVDARLTQGLHDYLVGSLPRVYRMLAFVAGVRGDKQRGIRTVQEVARHGTLNRVEAEVFLCALYRRDKKPELALPLLADLVRRFPRNYLLRFEQAQMYSALGDKERALAAVQTVAGLKRSRAPGYAALQWEKIWFQLGTIEFWYNDLEAALENMKKVTQAAEEVDLNTGVLAWMRVGQIYDLTHRRPLAVEAYKKAIAYAPQADAARESRRYLASPYRRERM
ncbi:MAG: tetratricopeptide repeat protein [Bryobacteraceae bacterium]